MGAFSARINSANESAVKFWTRLTMGSSTRNRWFFSRLFHGAADGARLAVPRELQLKSVTLQKSAMVVEWSFFVPLYDIIMGRRSHPPLFLSLVTRKQKTSQLLPRGSPTSFFTVSHRTTQKTHGHKKSTKRACQPGRP